MNFHQILKTVTKLHVYQILVENRVIKSISKLFRGDCLCFWRINMKKNNLFLLLSNQNRELIQTFMKSLTCFLFSGFDLIFDKHAIL